MVRAYGYLAVAGVVWVVEGVLLGYFLSFVPWQMALTVVLYLALFCGAIRLILHAGEPPRAREDDVSAWRYVALAPMLAVVVGSFASLPLLLGIVLLGKLV